MDVLTNWYAFNALLLVGAAAVAAYMTGWFVYARAKRRLDVVDTAWGGGFMVLAWLAVALHGRPATLLVAFLVSFWGLRLMKHTWRRHRRADRDDPRYTRLSRGWTRRYWLQAFLKIFLFQGLLAMVIAAPVLLNVRAGQLTVWAALGAMVWAAGFYLESTADRQLRDFLARPRRKKVMDEGLWRYSRHPNYFGESVQWFGIGLIAVGAPLGWAGFVGPVVLTFLLVFVSGIPTVERGKHKDPAYRRYQKRTSPFVPLPPRRRA